MANIFRAGTSEIIGVGVSLRVSEVHTAEATATEQPIEDGSIVSDHIILRPEVVEIIAEVTNVDGGGTLGEKAKTAWAQFKRQLNTRQLFDLVTFHEIYTDMALERVSAEHVAPRTGYLTLSLSFKKLNITQTTYVRVPASQLQSTGANPVDKTASSEIDAGTLPATDERENRSILLRAVESLGGAQ